MYKSNYVIRNSCVAALLATSLGVISHSAEASMMEVAVTIENLAPQYGIYHTPFWVGFHNGNWDTFNAGTTASASLERLAEDGDTTFLSTDFQNSGMGFADGSIAPGGPFAPGSIATATFMLDSTDARSRFFSYASMLIPSNDAFIGNDDAMGYEVFDTNGAFLGVDFFVSGAEVWDAGTEVNDEIPAHTAFFGQMMPNTGVSENGVIHTHPGFLGSYGNPGSQSILADPMFRGADFTLPDYPLARVTVSLIPAPGAMALFGLAGFMSRRRRRF